MRLVLSSLTKPELQEIIQNANFTNDEMMVFQLLSKGCQIDYIADVMSMSESTIKRISKRIYDKKERVDSMKAEVPIYEKVLMTVDEASAYSNIGVSTIRKLANDPRCTFVLTNGNRKLIKRKDFEKFLESKLEL